MTIKKLNANLIFLFFMLWLVMPSCIESYEEVNYPKDSEVIRVGSSLEQQLVSIALKDGSFDNILDNASCLTVQYPVDVQLDNERYTINGKEDLPEFEQLYESKITNRSQFELVFPLTVSNELYQTSVLNSQLELDQLANNCIEGGGDQDIECVDFNYPLNMLIYDPIYQKANVQPISSDEEFFYFINNRAVDNLIGFDFPLSFVNSDGDVESLLDNDELLDIITEGLSACDEEDNKYSSNTGGSDLSKLRLVITDAPYPIDSIESAFIRVTNIFMKYVSEDSSDFHLSDSVMVLNIFDLRNGVTETLTDTLIPSGSYSGFNIIIDSAVINLKDGRSFDLDIPSGAQSGVKVKLSSDLQVIADEQVDVLLDFDLSRSFVPKGNDKNPNGIKGFNFKPVLRGVNLAESGKISGHITDVADNQEIEGVTITLNNEDGELYASTFTEHNGAYTLLGVDPGVYTLLIERTGYITQEVSIEVLPQETVTADFELVSD